MMTELKIADFKWNIDQNLKISLKKGANVEILPGSWLKREANDISNIHSKFQEHTYQ